MNVLILGGTGYLGSKVVKAFLSEGHNVVVAKRESADLTRLENVVDNDTASLLSYVSTEIADIEDSMKRVSYDIVLNMVCNYGRGNTSYSQVLEANFEFPSKVFEKAIENGIAKMITIGTSLPSVTNMYSFSKGILGDLGRFWASKHKISFGHIKLEMFYGCDEPKDRFIPGLIRNMLAGKEVNVTLGTQQRDIISADDVVEAILRIKDSEWTGYQEIGVGTGIAPTVREIVDFIWKETGEQAKVNYGAIPMRSDEPNCVADISVMNTMCLGWKPIFWEDGLRKMIFDIQKEEEKNEGIN